MTNTYPEPYRSKPKNSLIDPSTCYNRQCTSYCAWKIKEATGNWPKRTGDMNARNWKARLAENGYKKVVSTPSGNGKCVGISTAGRWGHVVWANNSLFISEYNYNSNGNYHERTVAQNAFTWVQIKPTGNTNTSSSFLPSRGYWKPGDTDARIGRMASFMRKTFPSYTPKAALGNYFGPNLKRAVVEFQRRTGLQADGNVGPLTLKKMQQFGFKG